MIITVFKAEGLLRKLLKNPPHGLREPTSGGSGAERSRCSCRIPKLPEHKNARIEENAVLKVTTKK